MTKQDYEDYCRGLEEYPYVQRCRDLSTDFIRIALPKQSEKVLLDVKEMALKMKATGWAPYSNCMSFKGHPHLDYFETLETELPDLSSDAVMDAIHVYYCSWLVDVIEDYEDWILDIYERCIYYNIVPCEWITVVEEPDDPK